MPAEILLDDPHQSRALRYLSFGAARVEKAAKAGTLLLKAEGRAPCAVGVNTLTGLVKSGHVIRADGRVALAANAAPGRAGAAAIAPALRSTPSGMADVCVNPDESPLAALHRRVSKSGAPLLSDPEFAAGERLRADFTRAAILPRLGANWEATVSQSRRAGGGLADLTETALAAKLRVGKAMDFVGPELSGLLLDVCCFLKGLETVERERLLPARSAKMLLKAGLGILARHYAPPAVVRRSAHHWGADGFRPALRPGNLPGA